MKRPDIETVSEAYLAGAPDAELVHHLPALLEYIRYLGRNRGVVSLGDGNNQKGATIIISGNVSGGWNA